MLREIFGRNLRRLCEARGSIASVCRETGINRQQFNKYLNGSSLPDQNNQDRIARYFGVKPADLFRDEVVDSEGISLTVERSELSARLSRIAEAERPSALECGRYFVTFGEPTDPNMIVRAIMIVWHEGRSTVFRRLTGFAEPRGSWWADYGGDHTGVVMDRRQHLHFVGLNQVGNQEPTLITVAWTTSERPLLVGHAAVLGTAPVICPVVISKVSERLSLRRALASARAYSVDDPAIEAAVVDALADRGAQLARMLQPLDLSVSPLNQGRQTARPERLNGH